MARIRTIKPSFWTDEAVMSLSRDARLLTIGLISLADDDGRLAVTTPGLIGELYPCDEDVTARRLEKWLGEVETAGLIVRYRPGRLPLAAFPKWHAHQVINRYTPSKLPAPEGVGCTPRPTKSHGGTQ